jgi:hypothetical protein
VGVFCAFMAENRGNLEFHSVSLPVCTDRAACYHVVMTTKSLPAAGAALLATLLAVACLAGCSPKYNWRDYASADATYRVMFPAKPSTFTREIDLDGMKVPMTMTAAEIEGATFAVGTALAPDAARAQAAVAAMRIALVRNIDGHVTREKNTALAGAAERTASDVEAVGAVRGEALRLAGHFESRGTRFYQVIVVGKEKDMPAEQVEQFLTSFKPQ